MSETEVAPSGQFSEGQFCTQEGEYFEDADNCQKYFRYFFLLIPSRSKNRFYKSQNSIKETRFVTGHQPMTFYLGYIDTLTGYYLRVQ